MWLTRLVLTCSLLVSLAVPSIAAACEKTVHVAGYTKRDGTHVAAHDRCAPHAATATSPPPEKTAAVVPVARDRRGRIDRSDAARHAFMRQTGFPAGRPGYVIDHVVPLACGGPDTPRNMQWQTVAAAKAKDRTERIGCASTR